MERRGLISAGSTGVMGIGHGRAQAPAQLPKGFWVWSLEIRNWHVHILDELKKRIGDIQIARRNCRGR